MDKIDSVGESFSNKSLQKKTRKKKMHSVGAFSSLLQSAEQADEAGAEFQFEGEPSSAPVQEMMADISALGDALVKTPTLENVRRYRDGIRHFLKYLVAHVLEVEEKTSGANILKRKKYVMIKEIDTKLESLAREFLTGQRAPIDLAGRINEINGLLIDVLR